MPTIITANQWRSALKRTNNFVTTFTLLNTNYSKLELIWDGGIGYGQKGSAVIEFSGITISSSAKIWDASFVTYCGQSYAAGQSALVRVDGRAPASVTLPNGITAIINPNPANLMPTNAYIQSVNTSAPNWEEIRIDVTPVVKSLVALHTYSNGKMVFYIGRKEQGTGNRKVWVAGTDGTNQEPRLEIRYIVDKTNYIFV